MNSQSNSASPQLIVDQIRNGDQQAFKNLYLQHRAAFLKWAYKQFRCTDEEGKELYQVVTLIMYDNIVQQKLVKLLCTVQTYLCAVAKNKWKEWQRAKQKYQTLDDAFIMEVIETNDGGVQNEELISHMTYCLEQMGGRCQELLESYYYAQLSMQEISINMRYKNAATVKNLKYKYLKRLRRMIMEQDVRSSGNGAMIVKLPSK